MSREEAPTAAADPSTDAVSIAPPAKEVEKAAAEVVSDEQVGEHTSSVPTDEAAAAHAQIAYLEQMKAAQQQQLEQQQLQLQLQLQQHQMQIAQLTQFNPMIAQTPRSAPPGQLPQLLGLGQLSMPAPDQLQQEVQE